MFLTLDEPATLTHEEHKAIQVPPGVWEVGRVKEYDYFQEWLATSKTEANDPLRIIQATAARSNVTPGLSSHDFPNPKP